MSDKVIFKEREKEAFWEYWRVFAENNKTGPRYLRTYQELILESSKADGLLVSDKSFVLLENNEVTACVFLPVEKDGDSVSVKVKADGDFALAPIFLKNKKTEKKVFEIIDEIAAKENIGKIMFSIDSLSGAKYNFLQKFNYLGASVLTYLIDTRTGTDMLSSCREGCRKLIRSLLKNNDFEVFYSDSSRPDEGMHKNYEFLHHKCAGRVTRPQVTFDTQFEELKKGNSVLFGLKYKGKNVAFCYFSYSGNKAIYFSGADDPEYEKLPLYHLIIYSAMEYFQKRGIEAIDVGQPSAPSAQFLYYPEPKQLSISLFKRGFSGSFAENFRGIKYFSQQVFKKDADDFLSKYFAVSSDEAISIEEKEILQEKEWESTFGDEYTERNLLNEDLDELNMKVYGLTQKELAEEFLSGIDRSAKILEVGSNIGSQLVYLEKMGFKNLYAIELNKKSIEICRQKNNNINVVYGSALDIPFKDDYFDLVFTAGLLLHIAPENLKKAMHEIQRCSKRYIWCLEPFSESIQEVCYHGENNMMWKGNFCKIFLENFSNVKLVKKRKLKYLENNNFDKMFLLEKHD